VTRWQVFFESVECLGADTVERTRDIGPMLGEG